MDPLFRGPVAKGFAAGFFYVAESDKFPGPKNHHVTALITAV